MWFTPDGHSRGAIAAFRARNTSRSSSALLGNAQKFTRLGEVRLECSRDEEHFSITVTDTGCGIPSEQYDHVFERFTKLDTFSQGNGLGLYLCRLIVRHLGGEIHIDPDYTGGTRVVTTLPRK